MGTIIFLNLILLGLLLLFRAIPLVKKVIRYLKDKKSKNEKVDVSKETKNDETEQNIEVNEIVTQDITNIEKTSKDDKKVSKVDSGKKRHRLRFDQQKVLMSFVFLSPVLLGFVLFFAYPLIMSFIYSFSTIQVGDAGIIIHFGKYFETKNSFVNPISDLFYNYRFALREHSTFLVELGNTAWTTVLNTVVITIFSLLIAVMLNGNFKGRGLVRAIFFLPVIFNSDAITVALSGVEAVDSVLQSMGSGALTSLFDLQSFFVNAGIPVKIVTFLSGITTTIYSTISYAGVQILIFLAAIQSVPNHLYEAAKIEGATKYEAFWKITLPMVSPMIMTVVVYTIVDSFLRSDINTIISAERASSEFGIHAAMSWIYIIVSLAILGFALLVLSKVVFYHDDKK